MVAQIVFCFLMGVVLISPLGVASYFLLRWLRRIKPSWLVIADYFLAALALVFFNIALVVVVPLCLGAAHATRAIEGRDKASFYDFVKALSTTVLPSLVLLLVEILFISPQFSSSLSIYVASLFASVPQESVMALVCGSYLGLIVSPSIAPLFIWVRSSSKLRPGVDRLFAESELVPPEAP